MNLKNRLTFCKRKEKIYRFNQNNSYNLITNCAKISVMTKESTTTSLILHGHFYQPPRENPRTGVIPKQSSAMEWGDWNEKIYNDCYYANCNSRYLDNSGRIVSLTNNYSYISFNFGPTLLHWLDKKHPETVDMLRDADRKSIERLGHGNAMAQGFNHTILPLDSQKDAMLQIDWGIKDFEFHFKRFPEGLWLPECGVNDNVIQILSDYGIKFIILSPWQCEEVENEEGKMQDLGSYPAPYWKPYILTGSNGGTISAFFYHPELASEISFGHALRSADGLYSRLLDIKEKDKHPLIHTATDGEIYGHHEPYGDMALAALIEKVNKRDDFLFDNYGSFLEKNPAHLNARLKEGEDKKGTSWSCSHGVSRWYKDCGCHTGGEAGWNQAWRTPLRNGLNNLSTKLDSIFDQNIKEIFKQSVDPIVLLKRAGETFSTEMPMSNFIKSLHSDYDFPNSDDIKLSHLLSGIKYKHFSFTSCGFFFSDISGIEPRQDIKYALYAITMFQPFCKDDLLLPFLSDLKEAKSNINEQGDGMSIAQQEMQGLEGKVEACLYFYLNRSYATKGDYKDEYGRFALKQYKEDQNIYISLKDTESLEIFDFSVLSTSTDCIGLNLYISESNNGDSSPKRYRVTNSNIPERMLDETLIWIDNAMTRIKFNELETLSLHMKHFSLLAKKAQYTPMDTLVLENLGLILKLIKSLFLAHFDLNRIERLEILGNMFDFVRKFGRDGDIKAVNNILSEYLLILSRIITKNGLDESLAIDAITAMRISRAHGFEPETKWLQNAIYCYYTKEKQCIVEKTLLCDMFSVLNFKQ